MKKEIIYPLNNALHKRSKNGNHIILTPIGNLSVKTNPMLPDMKMYQKYDTSRYHNNYFIHQNGFKHLPYHYLITRNSLSSWNVVVGAPLSAKSHFLNSADFNGLISDNLSEAILVAFQDELNVGIVDPEMYEIIAYKVLQPLFFLMNKNSNIFNSIHFIDEIFDYSKYNEYYKSGNVDKMFGRLSNDNFIYDVKKSKTFDRTIMELSMRKYF